MISRKSLSELEQAIIQVMQGAPKEEEQKTEVAEDAEIEEAMAAGAIHPMALHVKPVQKDGKPMYHVHAVGKKLGGGIKAGEHLSDTELDDASEMGAKIKHMKEDQEVLEASNNKSQMLKNKSHEYNMDAAQREMDRRDAEGEDMTGAKIHPTTYEIIKPKRMKEEVEEIDEISKSTLGSYVKKASMDMANKSAGVEKDLATAKSDYGMMRRMGTKKNIAQNIMKRDVDTALSKVGKVSKRMGGIEKATDRLAKEEVEEVDFTIIEHNAFTINITEQPTFSEYLNAAKKVTENDEDAIVVANHFFKEQDESLIFESYTRSDIEDRANNWGKSGHQVSLPKYTTKDGKLHAEFTVTNKETGKKTKYVYHGTKRSVSNI